VAGWLFGLAGAGLPRLLGLSLPWRQGLPPSRWPTA